MEAAGFVCEIDRKRRERGGGGGKVWLKTQTKPHMHKLNKFLAAT